MKTNGHSLILPSHYAARRFVEDVGKRLWILGDLENQTQDLRDHYSKIAKQRAAQWLKVQPKNPPGVAETLAFSIHSEAENSWYALRNWLDENEALSIERDSEYLDIKEEEADYIGWLKKKGFIE